jgi:hypothetical protein
MPNQRKRPAIRQPPGKIFFGEGGIANRSNPGPAPFKGEPLDGYRMHAYYKRAYIREAAVTEKQVWRGEYGIETSAPADIIWSILCDVPNWKTWNAGIEHIEIDGPFEAGTWFTMKPPGEDSLRSRLVEVRTNELFVDETRLGDLAITVAHRIESLGAGRTRIVYAVDAVGPEAAEIGPAVVSDFPQVLAALAQLAEGRPA